jgi:CPA2 family monovalent cation:H+ antiporter-2
METVRHLRDEGRAAEYGDARHREPLEHARTEHAGHLILTSDVPNSEEIIRLARELNPEIHVLARTAHLRGVGSLRDAGADGVFSGEGEVALALTQAILDRLGATAEQVDRERERVHTELFGAFEESGADGAPNDTGEGDHRMH